MAAMAAPPGGYYDTGVIDSKEVQDQFPTLFRPIMEQLKHQFFADWSNTWVVYDMPELDVIMCLQAMRDIQLVKIKVLERIPVKMRVRLVQSCDDSSSSTAHRLHKKPGISRARNLFYQRKQKTFLLGDPEIATLYRGVDVTEMNSFQLGAGEDVHSQLGRYTGGSTFWTHRKETAEGYLNDETRGTAGPTGTTQGVLVTTSMSDLIKIADVNTKRPFEKYLARDWQEINAYIVGKFMDVSKLNKKFRGSFVDYVNDELEEELDEIIGNFEDKDYDLKYIVDVVRDKIEDCIEDFIDEDDEYITDSDSEDDEDTTASDKFWRKPKAQMIRRRAHPGDVGKFTAFEVWRMAQQEYNAAYLLKRTNEMNFTYHPWVTVEEIQRIRHYEISGEEDKKESAAGDDRKRKRRRLELVDLFPNLRF